MPKETVRDTAKMFDVRVGWSPGYVQVGTEQSEGRSLVSVLYGDHAALEKIAVQVGAAFRDLTYDGKPDSSALGRAILNAVEASATDVYKPFHAVVGTFDREGCNRLIRILRKARDQAFGADA